MPDRAPLVAMRNIYKGFGAVQALRGVDLELYHNEVLGLVGDNAAGKSTLMKILTGAYTPDAGKVFINGQPVHFLRPEDSRRLGIEMVYQDFALADNLDVASNIFLGREKLHFSLGAIKIIDKPSMEQESWQLLERLNIEIASIRARVETLSGGQRQAIAIARATAFDANIIIMDEPTAAMSVTATGKVLELIQRLKSEGVSIIMISHRLEDIYQVGDRVIVLRQGRKVGDLLINHEDLHQFREEVTIYTIGDRDDFSGGIPAG